MQPSDDALIGAYLGGEHSAFECLYRRYASRLLGFLTALGAPADTAEDLAQKTWIKVIGNLPHYRARDRFRPWLFTIAHRQWLDEVRSAGWRHHRMVEDEPSTDHLPHGGPIHWKGPLSVSSSRCFSRRFGTSPMACVKRSCCESTVN